MSKFIIKSFITQFSYQTTNGWKNCMTITKPKVTRIKPRLRSNMRQQTPLVFGQNGLGVDIVSTIIPPFRDVRVFTVEVPDLPEP